MLYRDARSARGAGHGDPPIHAWNLADALDLIAGVRADSDALVQGGRHLSWREVEARASALAAWMRECGASHQGKVAIYTTNHPAYLESLWGAMKAALGPVNVNYRYRAAELRALLDDADVEIAVVHEDFAPHFDEIRGELPKLRGVLWIADRGGVATQDAAGADYETVASSGRPAPATARSPDDLLLLYTGGTTGMPKGVMWRQADLYARLGGGGLAPSPPDREALHAFVRDHPLPLRTLVGPPLMHGTGQFMALIAWLTGGAVLLLSDPRHFDAALLWSTVERERANAISIVGDSFAKPMLRALLEGRRYDLSSLRMIASSGVMWSRETKQGLLEKHPEMALVDSLGSSEALGMAVSITTAAGAVETARFRLSDSTRLFDAELRPIDTHPGARGLVGVSGHQPVGYYKDAAKSARTFVLHEGRRFSIPGDWAEVGDDGSTLLLLGRGSVCINTGGEKVFPEEVEEVLKRHPRVRDAVVVGVPDERFGEAVTAVVSALGAAPDSDALVRFAREHLAGYKAPRHVVWVDEVYRSPSGKADFRHTRDIALAALGLRG
jgi:fatty-acyl-CoA synthase